MNATPAPAEAALYAPVRAQTAFDQTFRRLQIAIKLGLLLPGTKLPAERELCARFEISRSTLRQALSALTASGYLRASRGRGGGTFVVDCPPGSSPPDAEALVNWQQTCDRRLAIELGIVALAARKARPTDVEAINSYVHELEAIDDFDEYCRGDRHLHIAIAGLTETPELIAESARIQSAVSDLFGAIADSEELRATWNAQHRTLAEALMSGDQYEALRIMAEHLSVTDGLLRARLTTAPV